MKKYLLLSFTALLCCFSSIALAQERTISGKVTSADEGEPLPGVNIVLKGTTTGTVTDLNGTYSLNVPAEGGTLVFSFIGLESKEVAIGNRSVIDVQMESDVTQLSEVVVVGYGTSLKKELTGSIASISAEQIENLPIVSPEQALQGLAAGVFVGSSSGAPGGGINVRVRGQTSINASNSPLYVIDGVIVQSGNLVQEGLGGQEQNALSSINPQDIASIEVLKDAASTAIYGARAANGVVLITTKRGKSGAAKINLRAWTGMAEATNTIDKASAAEQIMIEREAFLNDNPGAVPPTNEELGWDGEAEGDWVDAIFRTARISEYNGSVSGGKDAVTYYVSGGYRDEEGVMIGSGFERWSSRLNLDFDASEKFKMGTSLSFASSLQKAVPNDNNIYGIYSAAILTPNYRPIRDPETGEFVDGLPSFNTNPVRAAEQLRNNFTTYRFIGNVNGAYTITEGLDFRTDFSYDWAYVREDLYRPSTTAQGRGSNGFGEYNTRDIGTWLVEPTLRYNKLLGESHKVSSVLGATWQSTTNFRSSIDASGFARPTLTYITSAATVVGGSSFRSDYSFNSVFGRINYSFDEKYLFSASVRRDGSSRFGPENRFGTFWAVSGGWNFSEEAFMDGVDFIDFGKIRASYGVTGNDRIGNFQYVGAFTGGANYLDRPASSPDQIANPSLGWEETESIDLGLEVALFASRININAGVFKSNTTGLLFGAPVPWTTGFSSVTSNIGEIENKGLELSLDAVVVDAGDFRWNTTINASWMRNEVVSLVNEEPIRRGFASAIIIGEPLNTFYGFQWLGVDPATGESVYLDANEDGIIGGGDEVVLGDHNPDVIGGFTNTMSFKGFTLDVFFQFVEGVDVYNNTLQFSLNTSAPWGLQDDILRRWQSPGDITDIPRVSQRTSTDFTNDNSRYISDGSYLRLKNITLAYDFPNELLSRINLNSLRLYVTGQNILTFTEYWGSDPEVSTFGATNTALGTDFLTFPQTKMYSFGLNVGL